MSRALVCPCGHKMAAANDRSLEEVVRKHVDSEHPELNYTKQDVARLVAKEAYDLSSR